MHESVDPMAIAAAILLALQGVKSSVDQQAQASTRAALADLATEPPDRQIQSIERALSILGDYPSAREAILNSLLAMASDSQSAQGALVRSLASPLYSRKTHGLLYVCPVDPTHYRRRVADLADYPSCPLHEVHLQRLEDGQ